MTEPSTSQSIAIIGAGIIGLTCAWELSRRGEHVTIYEQYWPPRGASWAAAGMIAPAYEAAAETEVDDAFLELCTQSAQTWPDFAADLKAASGLYTGYEPGPTLVVANDTKTAANLETMCREKWADRVSCDLVSPDELAELEPSLASNILAAVRLNEDAQVDNRAVMRALVHFVTDAPNIDIVASRVDLAVLERFGQIPELRGVQIGRQQLARHNKVLLATGAAGGQVERRGGEKLPQVFSDMGLDAHLPDTALIHEDVTAMLDPALGVLAPVRGQALSVAPFAGAPRHVVRYPGGYVVPKIDRIIIGATSEPGETYARGLIKDIRRLRDKAAEICPAIASQPILETWAGVRPCSPDERPLLGASRVEGLFMATGHYRNGVLLAPITAQIMADLIQGQPPSELASAFSPQRFSACTTV